ncbi:MAG: hypothetical protein ACRDZQ_08710, partial [Acidimicrobiales bacterium]
VLAILAAGSALEARERRREEAELPFRRAYRARLGMPATEGAPAAASGAPLTPGTDLDEEWRAIRATEAALTPVTARE